MAKFCRFCGAKMEDTARTCPNCKREVVESCAICGTKLYNNEAFCPGCGTPVVVKCAGCGKDVFSGERFCPYCGTRNEIAFPAAPVPQPLAYNSMLQYSMPYGMSCGGFGGYGLGLNGQFGTPIVLPPITLDGPAQIPAPEVKEAIVRTRPAPEAPAEPAQPVEPEEQPKKSKLGIAGFVLSLLSLFILPFLCLFGIPISAVAIKKDKDRKGLAIAGLVIGIIVLLLWVALLVWAFAFDGYVWLNANIFGPWFGLKFEL